MAKAQKLENSPQHKNRLLQAKQLIVCKLYTFKDEKTRYKKGCIEGDQCNNNTPLLSNILGCFLDFRQKKGSPVTERHLIFSINNRNKMIKERTLTNFTSKTKPEGLVNSPYSGEGATYIELARTEMCCPSDHQNECYLVKVPTYPRRYI